jgi:transposase
MCDAVYCRIKPLVAIEKKVRRRKADIAVAVEFGTGNARVKAINNKIKVTIRMGYGFRNTDNLIGVLMLRCSDSRPTLPGRAGESTKKKAA